MQHRKVNVGAGSVRANHELRPCSYQVVRATIAPKRIRQEDELVGHQFVVHRNLPTASVGGPRVKRSRSGGHHGGVRAGKEASQFGMEVSAGEFGGIGGLAEKIGHEIPRSRVGVVVELRANRAKARRKSDVIADKLVRVFNSHADGPVVIDVVGDSEFGSARVRHSDCKVLIFVIRDGQIGRDRADALAVRGEPAPCLSAYDHPFTAPGVSKVQPQTIRKAVHTLIHVGRAVSTEIALDVAQEVGSSEMVLDFKVEAGELGRGTEFSCTSERRVAERYGGKIGSDVALRVRGSKYILEINESSRS